MSLYSGGTGKTFTISYLFSYIWANGGIALATALCAVAYKLMEVGSTLHSKLKVPIHISKYSICSFNKNTAVGKLMQQGIILVIDDASMGHKHIYEAMDRSLREF